MLYKKYASALLIGTTLLTVGCSSTPMEEEQVVQQQEVKQEVNEDIKQKKHEVIPNDPKVQADDFSVEITDVEIKDDKLVIWYNYNNESDEEQTPIYTVSFSAFQKGVELDACCFSKDNYKEQDTILGGYSNEGLQDMMTLTDTTEKVLIRVAPWIDFSDTKYAKFEYQPSTDELIRIK